MIGIWSHNNAAWIVTLVAAARAGLISVTSFFTTYLEISLYAKYFFIMWKMRFMYSASQATPLLNWILVTN